jgi:hypothetical protein
MQEGLAHLLLARADLLRRAERVWIVAGDVGFDIRQVAPERPDKSRPARRERVRRYACVEFIRLQRRPANVRLSKLSAGISVVFDLLQAVCAYGSGCDNRPVQKEH